MIELRSTRKLPMRDSAKAVGSMSRSWREAVSTGVPSLVTLTAKWIKVETWDLVAMEIESLPDP